MLAGLIGACWSKLRLHNGYAVGKPEALAVCRASGSVLQWATCLVWRRGAWGLNIQWLLGRTNGLLVWLCMHFPLLQSRPTLCDPMDCSLLGFSVRGILQSRILGSVALPSSRGSSWPRDRTCISCLLLWQTDSLPLAPPGKLAWLASELEKNKTEGLMKRSGIELYKRTHANGCKWASFDSSGDWSTLSLKKCRVEGTMIRLPLIPNALLLPPLQLS